MFAELYCENPRLFSHTKILQETLYMDSSDIQEHPFLGRGQPREVKSDYFAQSVEDERYWKNTAQQRR